MPSETSSIIAKVKTTIMSKIGGEKKQLCHLDGSRAVIKTYNKA